MTLRLWMIAGLLGVAACGDDDGGTDNLDPDARPAADAASPDAGTSFTAPAPFAVPLSATGPDQLQAAAAGPDGSFYAVGFKATAVEAAAPRTVVVVKIASGGSLEGGFGGGDGVAETALDFRGGSGELGIAVQPSGKIVVSATVASTGNALDRDVALARLGADGAPDGDFGEQGIARLDLSTALINGSTVTAADAARGLAVDATGRIYVHAVMRGVGDFNSAPRTDSDFVVARLDAEGDPDRSFGDKGKYVLDIRAGDAAKTPSAATARGIHVLGDGSILASGYSVTAGLGPNPQPVLYKLDKDGAPVDAFGDKGVFHDSVLTTQTEIYNVAIHGTQLVTAGYGRESGDQNDWVSLRFDVATGARDPAWGGAANGVVIFDPSGNKVADNCRNAVALPGGKTMLLGTTGPGNVPEQDAVFAILDATGHLDTAYGSGVHSYAFGGQNTGNDQLWGGAVSGGKALMVGYRGGGAAASQTADKNDDAFAVLLSLK